jgi:hypothetical protein
MIKLMLNKYGWKVWTEFMMGHMMRPGGELFARGNEPSCSVKCGKILDKLSSR